MAPVAVPFSELDIASLGVFATRHRCVPVAADYRSGGVSYRFAGEDGRALVFAVAKLTARRWFGDRTYYYVEIELPDGQQHRTCRDMRGALEFVRTALRTVES